MCHAVQSMIVVLIFNSNSEVISNILKWYREEQIESYHWKCMSWSTWIGYQKFAPHFFSDFFASIDAAFLTLSLVKISALARHVSKNATENTGKKMRLKILEKKCEKSEILSIKKSVFLNLWLTGSDIKKWKVSSFVERIQLYKLTY